MEVACSDAIHASANVKAYAVLTTDAVWNISTRHATLASEVPILALHTQVLVWNLEDHDGGGWLRDAQPAGEDAYKAKAPRLGARLELTVRRKAAGQSAIISTHH